MTIDRRSVIKGIGGCLMLPGLEALGKDVSGAGLSEQPTRLLIVGNPFGAHPDGFFPKKFGKDFIFPKTIEPLSWLKDRITVVSHTDHNMVSGHGREVAYLSGVLPKDADPYPEKNMSIDQLIARQTSSLVRFPSINFGLGSGVRMSWTANGVEKAVVTDPKKLYNELFLNLTPEQKRVQRDVLRRNKSVLDSVGEQFAALRSKISGADVERLDQYKTSVRELEKNFTARQNWVDKDKPEFDISKHYGGGVTIHNEYEAVFDMIQYAFQTDLTRVATVAFPSALNYMDVKGVNRSYHGCTHNGKMEDLAAELIRIERFQMQMLSSCLKKLDAIPEPGADGSMLDHTVVMFGSGMGYGGTHSNKNLPILVAGGGFKHLGHYDASSKNGESMPLCNLYVTFMERFGIHRDSFNLSTGRFDALSV